MTRPVIKCFICKRICDPSEDVVWINTPAGNKPVHIHHSGVKQEAVSQFKEIKDE